MQRTGRKGHAMFRVVVQDSRRTPTSGKVVAYLGSYDPHSKVVILDKDKAKTYLDNGAQPSDRVVRMLKTEGVKLPDWVKEPTSRERTVRNAEKRRSTSPDEPVVEAPAEAEPASEAPVDSTEVPTEANETPEAPVAEEPEASAEVEPVSEASDEAPAEAPAEAEPATKEAKAE